MYRIAIYIAPTLALLAYGWLVASCFGADPKAPTQAVACDVVSVHDGDTIQVVAHIPILNVDAQRTIRAYGYDAWEVTKTRHSAATEAQPITDAEIVKGKAARDDLIELLATGKLYAEDSGERDPYGRTSAVLWLKVGEHWLLIGKWMEANGHLRVPRGPQ